MQNCDHIPAAMLRFRKIRGGTVAVSCFQCWMAMKTEMKTAKRTRRAMMRPSFQGYVEPPHWRANKRQTMLETKKTVPIGSSWLTCSRQGVLAFFAPGI